MKHINTMVLIVRLRDGISTHSDNGISHWINNRTINSVDKV